MVPVLLLPFQKNIIYEKTTFCFNDFNVVNGLSI